MVGGAFDRHGGSFRRTGRIMSRDGERPPAVDGPAVRFRSERPLRRFTMLVGDIMRGDVKTADAGDTFADVAKQMRANGISSVVVLGKDGALSGIVTERDIVNLVAAGGDPHTVEVAHGMTRRHLETIGPKADISEAAGQMVSLNIRHLPVVDKDRVVGILSIRDLTKWAAEELAGGHEMPDIARSQTALKAASELQKQRQLS
jgi:CBS domain-containing protein